MTIPREITSQNHRLGNALGRNPHGEPLYKWIWVNDWMHLMRDITGFQPTAQPSGLIVMAPIYKSRRMVADLDGANKHLKDRWHVGHWHDCGPEDLWTRTFGTAALWSRNGHYVMTDVWSMPGQVPSPTITDDLIIRVKQFRETTLAHLRESDEKKDQSAEAARREARQTAIDSVLTTYGNIPGTKGSVSYPSILTA